MKLVTSASVIVMCDVISLLISLLTVSWRRTCARRPSILMWLAASCLSNSSLVYGAFILLISVSTPASTAVSPAFSARCRVILSVILLLNPASFRLTALPGRASPSFRSVFPVGGC